MGKNRGIKPVVGAHASSSSTACRNDNEPSISGQTHTARTVSIVGTITDDKDASTGGTANAVSSEEDIRTINVDTSNEMERKEAIAEYKKKKQQIDVMSRRLLKLKGLKAEKLDEAKNSLEQEIRELEFETEMLKSELKKKDLAILTSEDEVQDLTSEFQSLKFYDDEEME